MSADFSGWLTHPVTLALIGTTLVVLALIAEILLRHLAHLGNVRFQGMVEEHGPLPAANDEQLHLAHVAAALRWTELVSLALLWGLIFFLSGFTFSISVVIGIAIPIMVVMLSQWLVGSLGENAIARLLRLTRHFVGPLAAFSSWGRYRAPQEAPDDEEEEASDREIRAFLDVGEAAGIIEGEEGEILESLVEFFDTTVRGVMTPRTEMISISENATWDELMEVFAKTLKSRLPVYRDTVDHIVGVVHVKNLVKELLEDKRPTVGDLFLPCLVVPEAKKLGPLLKEFQQGHQQMAIVVDEYGGTAGLVTLEDILEEIVGEIQDELEPKEPPEWESISPGVFRLQGRAPIEILNELFDLELDEGDVDTVGGLVFSRYGKVPEVGTEVALVAEGLHCVVDEMDGRRIVSVSVQKAGRNAETGSEG